MSELVKELIPYLEKLADKLGGSAEMLWALQIQQAKVTTICIVALYIINVLGIGGLFKWIKSIDREEDDFEYFFSMFCAGVIAVLTAINVSDFTTLITLIINPEYWALQEIIKMVK